MHTIVRLTEKETVAILMVTHQLLNDPDMNEYYGAQTMNAIERVYVKLRADR